MKPLVNGRFSEVVRLDAEQGSGVPFSLRKLSLETLSPKMYSDHEFSETGNMLVGYARVSTQDQDLSLQLDALQGAGCDKVFTEKASGAQRDRPALQAALDYMRGKDTLVVWKLDRLARSLKQLIETVEELGTRGIGLRSVTESLDTTTSGGKLVFHIFAALAEFERSLIRERTRSRLQAARRRGHVGGRPPALTSQDLAEARALVRDPEITMEQVAKRLGVAPSTLYRHLPGGRGAVTSRGREE
jgi:DNA invertase Pin-like site-specific DNA recombinase